jgi:glycosyltransferase involved in cell wall biosynthesis
MDLRNMLYAKFLKAGHVFLSCARSEGWNLPLIEAMACGTPSIYSDCSGQLEFAKGKGIPVKIKNEQVAHF